jgi:SAM-dependent methyltransferase
MTSKFYEAIIAIVSGKSVLDAGSIGHSYKTRNAFKTWNFAVLAQHAAKIKGFDLLAKDVEEARADGFDIEVGDAESYVALEKYDVVFAGDIIEHLSNPGKFIECSYKNLHDNGELVLATPNTYSFAKLLRVIVRGTNEPPVNPEHTFYFTPKTLEQLVSRHGFRLKKIIYSDLDYAEGHGSRWKRIQLAINSKASSLAPRFSQAIIAIFEKIPAASSDSV